MAPSACRFSRRTSCQLQSASSASGAATASGCRSPVCARSAPSRRRASPASALTASGIMHRRVWAVVSTVSSTTRTAASDRASRSSASSRRISTGRPFPSSGLLRTATFACALPTVPWYPPRRALPSSRSSRPAAAPAETAAETEEIAAEIFLMTISLGRAQPSPPPRATISARSRSRRARARPRARPPPPPRVTLTQPRRAAPRAPPRSAPLPRPHACLASSASCLASSRLPPRGKVAPRRPSPRQGGGTQSRW